MTNQFKIEDQIEISDDELEIVLFKDTGKSHFEGSVLVNAKVDRDEYFTSVEDLDILNVTDENDNDIALDSVSKKDLRNIVESLLN